MKNYLILLSCLFLNILCIAQGNKYKTIYISQFGANGNDNVNDTKSFQKAAKYINDSRGNIILVISKGKYIIGENIINKKNFNAGEKVLELIGIKNVIIRCEKGSSFIYENNLKYGSFDPNTHEKIESKTPYFNWNHARAIGQAFYFYNCDNITLEGLKIDGNIKNMIIGGEWGDAGRQVSHVGIYIVSSKNIKIKNVYVHHFAQDGMSINNKGDGELDNISIENSTFEYNGRQGLSWVGGNGVKVLNCNFNHTGRGGIASAPGAGVDIESEGKRINRNGEFINCKFINNVGGGMISEGGNSSNVKFDKCVFWGITNYSVLINVPNFEFSNCSFWGKFLGGYVTTNRNDATKLLNCTFEDKPYQSKKILCNYLLESDSRKTIIIKNCTFTANHCKVMWFNGTEQKNKNYFGTMENCTINVKTNSLPQGSFYAAICDMEMKNNKINVSSKLENKYYLLNKNNINLGGNNFSIIDHIPN